MMLFADLRDRPVFICGHPKSGTSLLRNLLDSHPQLVVYPEETGFFRRFLKESVKLDLESQLDLAEEKLLHIFEWNPQDPPPHQAGFPDRDYSAIPFEKVVSAMQKYVNQEPVRHAGDILSASVLAFGDVSGQKSSKTLRWVEKTPYNERFAQRIFTWWPDALCIHIVRDPRDNFASYSRKHKSWTAEFFAENWRNSTRLGLATQKKFKPERYWILRYESLVQDPKKVIDQLCDFLEIEEHPTLRIPTRNGIPWEGNSMFADAFEQISAAPAGRWRTELSPSEIASIEAISGKLMSKLEYIPESGIKITTKARAYLWKTKKILYRILWAGRKDDHIWSPSFDEEFSD